MSARRGRAGAVVLVAVTAVFVALVVFEPTPLLRGPAPYPPEWRWERRHGPAPGPLAPALVVSGLLVAGAALSGSAGRRLRPDVAYAAGVTAAVALGWALQLALLAVEPDGVVRTLLARTTSRTITSYHTAALLDEARDPAAFLDRHAALLPRLRKEAKHAATHPPGPVLFFRALVRACERLPGATRAIAAAAGLDAREPRLPQTPATRVAALVGALLFGLAGALAAWPAAALARSLSGDARAGARVALVWATVPGVALMAPALDQALALPVAAAAAALARALRGARGRALALAAGAGLAAALGAFLSYGALAFTAVAALAVTAWAHGAGTPAGHAVRVLGVAAAAASAAAALPALLGHEVVGAARAALAIHREDFTAPRDYALWLGFNALDFAIFAGPPLALLFAARVLDAVRDRGPDGDAARFRIALAAGLAALLASGLTRGEVGRLWIPLMPLLTVAALAERGSAHRPRPGPREAALVVGLLAAVCLALRVFWRVPA